MADAAGLRLLGARRRTARRWVFALEKLAYVCGWLRWHATVDARALVSDAWVAGDVPALFAAVFHCGYGAGDLLFAVAFARHALRATRPRGKRRA